MPESGEPGEVHPHNPAAVRGPNGIWNEEALPILLWEVPTHRKVVPPSVQAITIHPSAVIRVSIDIDRKVREKHLDILSYYENFDLRSWTYVREVPEPNGRRWEFVEVIDDGTCAPWPLMTVIGIDEKGSLNLISLHRRNRRWMMRVIRGELGFQKQVK